MGEIDAGSFRQITRENGAPGLPDRRGSCAAERAGSAGDQDDVAGKRLWREHYCASRSVALISSAAMPGSESAWPPSSTTLKVPADHCAISALAVAGGQIMS